MPTTEDRYLVRLVFRCRAILANGKVFQDLFWDVMQAKHGSHFAPVAPQGRKGDGGNDGYHTTDQHYYQLFSPIAPREKVSAAVRKLDTDFHKVRKQWGSKSQPGLNSFSFAFNDKYEGAPKEVEQKLNEFRAKYAPIRFHQYCCRNLEDDFMALPDEKWDGILGMPIPAPDRVTRLDYSVLGEVIRYIMCAEVQPTESRLDLPPELDSKIGLNKLARRHAIRIQNGALQSGHVVRYLDANSSFALSELRSHVVGVYETAKKAVRESPPNADQPVVDAVFAVFRRALFPKHASTASEIAVDAIIGYFFEACDVFDPTAAKELPGASP